MASSAQGGAGSGSGRLERQTSLTLRLGEEEFDLVSLTASEGLSQPFLIVIDVISKLGSFDLLPHLGKPAMVESLSDGSHLRYFHGIISDGHLVGEATTGQGRKADGEFHYRLTLQPKAHFHTYGRDNRIYQDMAVSDIVKDVLTRCNIDFEEKLQGPAHSRMLKYCVQFGESDMSFVARLMEEHGLYYAYRHDETKHVMLLCDTPNAHTKINCATLTYHPHTGSIGNSHSEGRGAGTQTVTNWQEFLRTGGETRTTMRDYDFIKPTALIESKAQGPSQHENDAVEVYEWPGRFFEVGQGNTLAEIILQGRRAQRISYQGASGCTEVQAGQTFTLRDHPNARFNASYLVIGAYTTLANEAYSSGSSGGETEVQFTAIPADIPYRAPQVTPRPVARGPETAVVTGPAGEEIHVDKYGRIKVHFHWDRLNGMDDGSSCWIRVSQTGGLGNIIIPRVGHEVLVDFIHGDPDRPIVVGRVFNQAHMPAYALPEHKTKAVWRSKTYQRTESNTPSDAKPVESEKPAANEIRFEDKTGDEEFFVHAEKNMNTVIRYSETRQIGLDQTLFVGQNQMITIGQDRTDTVGRNESISIGKSRTETVAEDEKVDIGGKREHTVGTSETRTIGTNSSLTIAQNDSQTIGAKQTINVGTSLEITAGSKIVLVVGGSKIEMTPSAITISSPQFTASATTAAKVSGGATLDLEGGMMTKLVGAMVKIN